MRMILTLALLSGMSCQADETVRAYGAGEASWRLIELDGKPFTANATLSFPEEGRIGGRGPCNGFSGTMTLPYPWFKTGPLLSTRRACPELRQEQLYFTALGAMSQIEVLGDVMILRNEAGREMVFNAGG